jgi:hypothetical protein
MTYDLIGVMNKAIEDFDTKSINVVTSTNDDQGKRYLSADNNGYQFSQKRMIEDIDMAYNSVYKKGKFDREGQRKLYLNIMRFYVNVAVKNTNVNTSDYQFSPTDFTTDNLWEAWFFKRQFSNFVMDEHYGEIIDQLNFDFNKYGSCVQKTVKDDVIRVPLRSIRNDQAAVTILDGIEGGIPFMIQHEYSHYQMTKFKEWDVPEEFEGKRIVQEMYAMVPKYCIEDYNGRSYNEEDESMEEKVLVMAIVMPTGRMEEDARRKYKEHVIFIEQIDELPFEECHNEKQDGRWLGIGEAEKQLEAQIARNLSANLRRRSMLWASKQIFQTQGDEVSKNLVKNVQDGEVLQVGINGLIQKVDTSTRSLADYGQDEQIWDANSKQQAFAFESVTGESMSSGTPFRLGAMLSNSAMSYFDGKKQTFGMFLERAFFSQIIPIFQKRAKDDIVLISSGEKGYDNIKNLFVEMHVKQHEMSLALNPNILNMNVPSREAMTQHVQTQLVKSPYLGVEIPKEVFKQAKYKVKLNITGENTNKMDVESLTTTYQTMVQAGDPRASQLVDVILGSKGINLNAVVGQKPQQAAQVNPAQPQGAASNPDLAGLLPANANQ